MEVILTKIFVDSQGNWQEYQLWHDEVVMNEPDRFTIVEVDGLPNNMRSPKFINGEFVDFYVEVSAEEQQAKEAEKVASEYEAKFKAIDDEIIRAEVIDKDTEYADELRQQREALQMEFAARRGEL